MRNIREEKGLTYGIYSALVMQIEMGYLSIGSDVKRENTQLVVDEILKEIEILRTELIPADELETVKNYIGGSFAAGFDNAFSLAEKFKAAWLFGISMDMYSEYLDKTYAVSAEELRELAQKYLNPESLQLAIAGGKN